MPLKAKLPSREIAICRRLRSARELLGLTQKSCAAEIGMERGSLANYEYARAPLRYEVALRFCRNLGISEEGLATGRFDALRSAGVRKRLLKSGDRDVPASLQGIFLRQAMDLLSEPIVNRIAPGTPYSRAFDEHLSVIYTKLA